MASPTARAAPSWSTISAAARSTSRWLWWRAMSPRCWPATATIGWAGTISTISCWRSCRPSFSSGTASGSTPRIPRRWRAYGGEPKPPRRSSASDLGRFRRSPVGAVAGRVSAAARRPDRRRASPGAGALMVGSRSRQEGAQLPIWDDFDDLLLAQLQAEFQQRHGVRIDAAHPQALARLWWAAEAAKKELSFQPYAQIREEALITENGKPLHLELELSRDEYEKTILHLVESTLDSVSKALGDAGRKPGDLDAILLVGGSTRTPLVSRLLRERTGLDPREDVHPDLCVALGAGVLASRLAGRDVERVLVDVSPYSFGPSYLGQRGGAPYPYCYHPIIRRNTPLPVTRTESYYTSFPGQREVDIRIFQGDNEDALQNILVGDFHVEGLAKTDEPNEVLCRMSLDIDGILHVAAIEKRTGKSKHITIADALQAKSDAEIAAARKRIADLYASREAAFEEEEDEEEDAEPAEVEGAEPAWENGVVELEVQKTNGKIIPMDSNWVEHRRQAVDLIQRSRRLLDTMHAEDKEEAIALTEAIETAVTHRDSHALVEALKSLQELLFFVEGG